MPGKSYDNGRLQDMLMQVGLESRLLAAANECYCEINYYEVNIILDKKRQNSMSFVDKIIND